MKVKQKLILLILLMTIVFATGCILRSTDGAEEIGGKATGERDGDTDFSNTDQDDIGTVESENSQKEALLKEMMDIPMEDFEAVDLSGDSVKLSDYKGKIIFLNFWATWCPPCREEMPVMQQIYEDYKDEDVVILAVNPTIVELQGGRDSDRAQKKVKEFLADKDYTFPIFFDEENKAWSIYQQRGIPVNYIIDKQGIVRYGFSGAFQNREQMELLINNIRAIE